MKPGDMVRVNTSRVVERYRDSTWTDLHDDDMCWHLIGCFMPTETGVVLETFMRGGGLRVKVLTSEGKVGWCYDSGLTVVT